MSPRREFLLTACAAAAAAAIAPLFPDPAQVVLDEWAGGDLDAWMEAEMLRYYRQDPELVLRTMNYVMSLRDDAPELEAARDLLNRARTPRRTVA
jgi:hypothetical protein